MSNQALATTNTTLKGSVHPEFRDSRDGAMAVVMLMVREFPSAAIALEGKADAYIRVLAGTIPHQRPHLNAEEIHQVYCDLIDGWAKFSIPPTPGAFKDPVAHKITDKARARRSVHRLNDAASAAILMGRRWRKESYIYDQFPGETRYYEDVKWWKGDGAEPITDREGNPLRLDHWGKAENFKRLYNEALIELPAAMIRVVERAVRETPLEIPLVRGDKRPAVTREGSTPRKARVGGGAGTRGLPESVGAVYARMAKEAETKPK